MNNPSANLSPSKRARLRRQKARHARIMFKNTALLICLLLLIQISGFLVHGIRINFDPPIIREYTVTNEKIQSPLTIIMLSDLHGCEHGEGNSELIRLIGECNPDIILMCGDMINGWHETEEDILVTAALIKELSAVAPIYYSLGNHELARIGSYWDTSLPEFKEAGAIILEREYTDLDISGNQIRIGGIYTPNDTSTMLKPDITDVKDFFFELCETERFLILMEHRPGAFSDEILPAGFEPELVLSGHMHGGHVRLPILGPVVGASWGFFPKYALGRYELEDSTLIVSAGLSNQPHIIPRINNPTEITKITLEPLK